MATKEINDLTAKATPITSDEIVIQETGGGTTKKATLANAVKGMSHTNMADIGTNTHAQIDTAVTNSTNHIADMVTTSGDIPHGLPLNKYNATTAPTANSDASNTDANGVFGVGSVWVDVTGDATYVCVDATATAAVWNQVDAAAGVSGLSLAAVDVEPTSSGTDSIAIGDGADATNTGSIAIGEGSNCSTSYAIAIGKGAEANDGVNSICIGRQAGTSSGAGDESVTIGYGAKSLTNADRSVCIGYLNEVDRDGEHSFITNYAFAYDNANDRFSSFPIGVATTDATQTELVVSPWATNGIAIPADTTMAFSAFIVGRRTDGGAEQSACYKLEGVYENNGGVTSVVGTVSKTVIAEDDANWDVTVDDTATVAADALIIDVIGAAGASIRWRGRVDVVQVGE